MKRYTPGFALLCKYVAVLILIFTSLISSAQETWIQVPSPDGGPTRNILRSISGTSSSDVWTVGDFEASSGGTFNLFMHWNGTDWQLYPGTDLGYNYNNIWGVAAITSNDVWAAGTYNTYGGSRSQLLHWNGSNWTHTTLPVNTGGSFLFDIDAISANDIWAVGGQAGSPTDPAYTVHYDGSNWTEIVAASPGSYYNNFESVDGIASNDVWAVGRQANNYGNFHVMAQHWDGTSWTNSPLPASVASPIGGLYSVTMISSDNVWVLGSTITGGLIMLNWDGANWSLVPTAGSAGGVIASREPDLFALGHRISEWDGTSWSVIDSLNQLIDPSLGSSVTFSNGDIWAAGHTYDYTFHTLVYRTISQPLSVLISYQSLNKSGTSAILKWKTSSEINAKEFIMQRSADAVNFTTVNRIDAQGSGYNYELIDSSPLQGLNYYRLQLIDWDGEITNFPVRTLSFESNLKTPFTIYPNPVEGREVNVWLNQEGDYILYLFDLSGQEVVHKAVNSSSSMICFNLPENILPGAYMLSAVKDKTVWSEKIFVQ